MRLPFWRLRWPIALVTLLLFVISTLNLALGLVRVLAPRVQRGPLPRDWLTVTKTLLAFVQVLIADSAFIYRCWIVYSKSWLIVAFPIVMWMGNLSSILAYSSIQSINRIPVTVANRLDRPLAIAAWSLTISTNIYASTIIVARIWLVDKRSAELRSESSSRLMFIVRIVIESALLYTCTSIFAFFTVIFPTTVGYIAAAINIQMIGLAFNLILIRLAHYPSITTEGAMKFAQRTDTDISQTPEPPHVELTTLNDGTAEV